uniref:NADH-ubiquinone oxidoreductase chain 4L n=1 Tax=Flustrellidra hispida TaxID=97271 RepID=Q15K50_9BILA|nr:NADH dehydrogenase subunit 4L [Flustrellidra hispida]AAZ76751.1 NADH dehydrogenase subunit 4L [Flustrellidra hispida]
MSINASLTLASLSLLSMLFSRNMLLSLILCFEVTSLACFMLIVVLFVPTNTADYSLIFFMLILGVCEATMALNLLVLWGRSCGSSRIL